MAPVTPPAWLQAGSYSARLERLALSGLVIPNNAVGHVAARAGVKPSASSNGMRTQQRSTPDRWVTIRQGTCYIPATSSVGGVYICHNDADYDVQTAASHATLARKDLIYARVRDAVDDTGSSNDFIIDVVTGTPASSPTRPATPSQGLALAEVSVAAASTTVTNGNITDLRQYTVGLGGVLPCVSSADIPASPHFGMKIFRLDTKSEYVYDGTAWQQLNYGVWTAYTPSWTAVTTNPTLGNGTAQGRYVLLGKTVHFQSVIQCGSTTAYGSGHYRIGLPPGLPACSSILYQCLGIRVYDTSSTQPYQGQGVIGAGATFCPLHIQGTNADMDAVTPTSPSTLANGDTLHLYGTYETD